MLNRRGLVSCAICAATGLIATKVDAQAPAGLTRTLIQQTEYPGDKHVCLLMTVDIDANFLVARHTHPGVESSYFITGGGTLSVKGQPDRVLKAGEGFQIPPEVPHKLQNGVAPSKIAITYIVEKDKPLVTPAPE
jgi:quercetin dioxygenase-like cupin family protein